MAGPSESQGRAANHASFKPSPSASPQSNFTAAVRDAVLDSLQLSLRTQEQHLGDSNSIKDPKLAVVAKRNQMQGISATQAAFQQAKQTAVGSGPDAVKKLLDVERFARAQVAQIVLPDDPRYRAWVDSPAEKAEGWRKLALDSVDQAIAKTTQALGQ